jgi:tyrosyl-tRNA synthetase
MKNKTEEALAALERRVENFYPSKTFVEEALRHKKLSVYLGIDPTTPHLHIGHLIPLLILRHLQDAGHRVTLLAGDFTALIGDPTDKLAARQPMTVPQVNENLKTFKKQAGMILRFTGPNPVQIKHNSAWHKKMTFAKVIELAQHVTVQQMIERDMFKKRMEEGRPIGVHEFLYPLMQGYDSVALDTDMELGGNDQTFNMLMGRTLMKNLKNKEKIVVATKLLLDPGTGAKMGKTAGALINLDDTPSDVFGKAMSMPDEFMFPLATLATEMPMERIETLQDEVASATLNPRDAKLEIAEHLVALLFEKKTAKMEREKFLKLFSKNEISGENIPLLKIPISAEYVYAALIVKMSPVVKSAGEAWRLVQQGGFEISGKKITDPQERFRPRDLDGKVAKIGKHHFFRLKVR